MNKAYQVFFQTLFTWYKNNIYFLQENGILLLGGSLIGLFSTLFWLSLINETPHLTSEEQKKYNELLSFIETNESDSFVFSPHGLKASIVTAEISKSISTQEVQRSYELTPGTPLSLDEYSEQHDLYYTKFTIPESMNGRMVTDFIPKDILSKQYIYMFVEYEDEKKVYPITGEEENLENFETFSLFLSSKTYYIFSKDIQTFYIHAEQRDCSEEISMVCGVPINFCENGLCDKSRAQTYNNTCHAYVDNAQVLYQGECKNIDKNIIAYWKFDNNFTDISSFSQDLYASENYIFEDSPNGKALVFNTSRKIDESKEVFHNSGETNAKDDPIQILSTYEVSRTYQSSYEAQRNTISPLNPVIGRKSIEEMDKSAFMISGWFKASPEINGRGDIFQMGTDHEYSTGLGIHANESKGIYGLEYWINLDGIIVNEVVTTEIDFRDMQWHQFAFAYQNNTIQVFIDGLLIYTQEKAGNITSPNSFFIGNSDLFQNNNNNLNKFIGSLDEIKIYKKPLSEKEVLEEYKKSYFEYITSQKAQSNS